MASPAASTAAPTRSPGTVSFSKEFFSDSVTVIDTIDPTGSTVDLQRRYRVCRGGLRPRPPTPAFCHLGQAAGDHYIPVPSLLNVSHHDHLCCLDRRLRQLGSASSATSQRVSDGGKSCGSGLQSGWIQAVLWSRWSSVSPRRGLNNARARGREERRQGRFFGSRSDLIGRQRGRSSRRYQFGHSAGPDQEPLRPQRSGQGPGPVTAGEADVDEGAQVDRGGPVA